METIYQAFSCGTGRPIAEIEFWITREVGSAAIRQGLAALPASSRFVFQCLESVLSDWAASPQNGLWHPEIGKLRKALLQGQIDHVTDALIQAAINASLAGMPGDWSIELQRPVSLRLGCRVVPEVASVAVGHREKDVSIQLSLSGGKNLALRVGAAPDGVMEIETGCESSSIICPEAIAGDVRITVVPALIVDPELIPAHANVRFVGHLPENFREIRLNGALTMLEACAPASLDWIGSTVRDVVLCAAPPDQLSSSSSPWECGVVALTGETRTVPLAEMLVHEASHQHFFIAKLLGPIHDGSDAETYFSPMAGRHRPLEKLLLAFHALGNMALMYAQLLSGPPEERDYCSRRLAGILEQIHDMTPPLSSSAALTPLGRAIYEPLAARVHELRSLQ